MKAAKYLKTLGLAAALAFSANAFADNDKDIEGTIQSIDQQTNSFVVKGQTFYADDRTDYDDDLNRFSDLQVGQKVEVDYIVRDGRNIAKEIELDD